MSKAILSVSNRRNRKSSLWVAGFAGAMLLVPQLGMSATGGVFAPFLGSWKGSGEVTVNDGHKERISCRATYSASDNGGSLTQSLTCAGDAYRFQVQSYVEATGQSLLGHWEEENRNVAGQLKGQVSGGKFVGNITGPTFTAEMVLNATQRQQIVSIKPHGASYSSVDIVLDRQR